MTNSNTSTSFIYNLYSTLMAQGIDPDTIDWSAIVDPAFEEDYIF